MLQRLPGWLELALLEEYVSQIGEIGRIMERRCGGFTCLLCGTIQLTSYNFKVTLTQEK